MALCTALRVQRPRGPRPSRTRQVLQYIRAEMANLSDEQKAAFLEAEVTPALRRAKRNAVLAQQAHPTEQADPRGLIEMELP